MNSSPVDSLLPVEREHGWTLRPSLADSWLQYLDGIPAHVQFPSLVNVGPVLDVFTDGSCLYPTVADLRMASWSVILARPYALDFGPRDFFAVAAQPLAGLLQSAYRAELFAIVTAMKFAIAHKCSVRIWTDCQSAIDAFCTHVRDGIAVKAKSMQVLALEIGTGCVDVLKVPAHTSLHHCNNDLERWLITGNDFADKAAKAANVARPVEIWKL